MATVAAWKNVPLCLCNSRAKPSCGLGGHGHVHLPGPGTMELWGLQGAIRVMSCLSQRFGELFSLHKGSIGWGRVGLWVWVPHWWSLRSCLAAPGWAPPRCIYLLPQSTCSQYREELENRVPNGKIKARVKLMRCSKANFKPRAT